MPRGGARPGAGRPRKTAKQHFLSGDAGKRKLALVPTDPTAPAAGAAEAEPLPMPGDLRKESEQALWERWADRAQQAGTLTHATLPGFVLLCQVAARLAEVEEDLDREGLTFKADGVLKSHPLLPTYRGLVQRQEMLLQRYQLAAMSKAVVVAQPPDEDAEARMLRELMAIR